MGFTDGWSNRLAWMFNTLLIGMLSNRRRLVECIGMCFIGVCRLLGWLLLLLSLRLLLLTVWLRLLHTMLLARRMHRWLV